MTESPDAAFVGAYALEVGNFLKSLRRESEKVAVIAGGAAANRVMDLAAGSAADGLFLTLRPDPREAPEARTAVDAIRAMGFEPEGYRSSPDCSCWSKPSIRPA